MGSDLEHHVRQAKNGNRQALETVVGCIQGKIYGLALRMLRHPEDAEDEAQEILIKVITHLSDFREESAFTTWVYRVSCNHLLTTRKKSARMKITFDSIEEMSTDVTNNTPSLTVSGPERDVLLEEVRFDCMQAVLTCLEREVRIAVILGDSYDVTSKEGAFILGITPEAFRTRLSRGRKRVQEFMEKHCGLVNKNNACRCHRHAAKNLEQGQAIAGKKTIVKQEVAAKGRVEVIAHLRELSEIDRTVEMFRRYPEYKSPDSFSHIVRGLIDSGKYQVFSE